VNDLVQTGGPPVEAGAASRGSLLVVDDEPAIVRLFRTLLCAEGYTVEVATNGRQAVAHLDQQTFDTIISDIAMPQLDGIGLLRAVRERDLDVPVVLMSGNPSVETAAAAVEYGALRYLCKPIETEELLAVIERAREGDLTTRAIAELPRRRAQVLQRFTLDPRHATELHRALASMRTKRCCARARPRCRIRPP
jgi:DNA-binding NtrC family response regulator